MSASDTNLDSAARRVTALVFLIANLQLWDYLTVGTVLLSEVSLCKAYDICTVSHLYALHFLLGDAASY